MPSGRKDKQSRELADNKRIYIYIYIYIYVYIHLQRRAYGDSPERKTIESESLEEIATKRSRSISCPGSAVKQPLGS